MNKKKQDEREGERRGKEGRAQEERWEEESGIRAVLKLFRQHKGYLGPQEDLSSCFPIFAVPLTSLCFSVLARSLANGIYTVVPEAGAQSQCLHYFWMP